MIFQIIGYIFLGLIAGTFSAKVLKEDFYDHLKGNGVYGNSWNVPDITIAIIFFYVVWPIALVACLIVVAWNLIHDGLKAFVRTFSKFTDACFNYFEDEFTNDLKKCLNSLKEKLK